VGCSALGSALMQAKPRDAGHGLDKLHSHCVWKHHKILTGLIFIVTIHITLGTRLFLDLSVHVIYVHNQHTATHS
jgi:hypothetical protein